MPDAIAVVDHLGIDKFVAVGASTGGAYALALASQTSRAIAVVACCAVSDLRWRDGRAMNVSCNPVWNAQDRNHAMAIVIEAFGEHGENLVPPRGPSAADPSDASFFASPPFLSWWISVVPEMFTHGVAGYVDDRLADATGWTSFDVANITCPVTVLHGGSDGLVPVANARYTAAIVPGANLHVVEHLGHVSILSEIVEVTKDVLARCARAGDRDDRN